MTELHKLVQTTIEQIDSIHRELARMSLDQRLGMASALTRQDVFEMFPIPTKSETIPKLQEILADTSSPDMRRRIEVVIFGCMDLTVEQEISSIADMVNFYNERGRMIVNGKKIPALEVVPWLQAQPDFDRREEMRKECDIWFKSVINPMLTAILELTIKVVTQKFGFDNYVQFSEAKKQVSFKDQEEEFKRYLIATGDIYHQRMKPWVEEVIGRPFQDLSRYHALYLIRIKKFDEYFPKPTLRSSIEKTFQGLGFPLQSRDDVILNIADDPVKNPDGVCIGEEIPGKVHVLMKPIGGLIDAETLLHETGHAFFLSHFDPQLPLEYRRLYRSPALDEAFAFLFMELTENPVWLTNVVNMPIDRANDLSRLMKTKRLCLIRRYIGKFLAEKELHETGDLKNAEPYCQHLGNATGFVYEPRGYLVDMEPDFYSLDYLQAWGGAHVLRSQLEEQFGLDWFQNHQAGELLRQIAKGGRRDSLDNVLELMCGKSSRLPVLDGD